LGIERPPALCIDYYNILLDERPQGFYLLALVTEIAPGSFGKIERHVEGQFMQSATQTAPVSKKMLWAGRITSALPVLLLLFSGVMKLLKPAAVVQGFAHFGYPEHLIFYLGILEIACTVTYMIPRTSILGAILMTSYLGGATATNVRIGDPSFFFPVLAGVLVWGGLFFRDERVRALIPLRR
jgi:hypothetical protein